MTLICLSFSCQSNEDQIENKFKMHIFCDFIFPLFYLCYFILLYCYPSALPLSLHRSWGIYDSIEWAILFFVDISPCPLLLAIMSQLFHLTIIFKFFTAWVLLWPPSRWKWLSDEFPRCNCNRCRFVTYKIVCHWNLFSDWP